VFEIYKEENGSVEKNMRVCWNRKGNKILPRA